MSSTHESNNLACTSCHKLHAERDAVLAKATQSDVCYTCHRKQRADFARPSAHPVRQGRIAGSECHSAHGSAAHAMLNKSTVNQTCYSCHAEKRGPFLWEHGPVIDDCSNCHTPHGSNTTPLLKARVPWLCQECHSGDHGSTVNSGANLAGGNATTVNGRNPLANAAPRTQLNARACLNCHVQIHGSNSPNGSKFNR